jgi:HEAT repeat protein
MKLRSIKLIVFREGEDHPAEPELYCQELVSRKYGSQEVRVAEWCAAALRNPMNVKEVAGLYSTAKTTSRLPDFGDPFDYWEGKGPDDRGVVVLFFWGPMNAQGDVDSLARRGEGYDGLPEPILTVLERARTYAEANRWENAIPLLVEELMGRGNSQVPEGAKLLVQRPLALCLCSLAMESYQGLPSVKLAYNAVRSPLSRARCSACEKVLVGQVTIHFSLDVSTAASLYKGLAIYLCNDCKKAKIENRAEMETKVKLPAIMQDLLLAAELDPSSEKVKASLDEAAKVASVLGVQQPVNKTESRLRLGLITISELAMALKKENQSIRRVVVKTLGNIGPKAIEAVPMLVIALEDEDVYVCKAVAEALGKIGPAAAEAIPALVTTLKTGRKGNSRQIAAAGALAGIGPATNQVIPALLGALADENDLVCEAAAEALGKIGPAAAEAVPALAAIIHEGRTGTRQKAAVEALTRIGPITNQVILALLRALANDNFGDLGRAANEGLMQILDKIDPADKEDVIGAFTEAALWFDGRAGRVSYLLMEEKMAIVGLEGEIADGRNSRKMSALSE